MQSRSELFGFEIYFAHKDISTHSVDFEGLLFSLRGNLMCQFIFLFFY